MLKDLRADHLQRCGGPAWAGPAGTSAAQSEEPGQPHPFAAAGLGQWVGGVKLWRLPLCWADPGSSRGCVEEGVAEQANAYHAVYPKATITSSPCRVSVS